MQSKVIRRAGVSLVEVVVAAVLVAGPLLVALQLIHQNLVGAAANRKHMLVRTTLTDFTRYLMYVPIADIRSASGPAGRPRLEALLDRRVALAPGPLQNACALNVGQLRGRLDCLLEENVEGCRNLMRLTLSAKLGPGVDLRVVRHFQPSTR